MSVDRTISKKPHGPAETADGDMQPELRCEYAPIMLEDLLCGLPPIEDEDEFSALADAALEPALLLSEIAQPSPVGEGGWTGDPVPAEPEAAAAEPAPPEPVAELHLADPGAAMEAMADIAAPAPAEDPAPAEESVPAEQPGQLDTAALERILALITTEAADQPAPAAEPESQPEPAAPAADDDLAARVEAIIAAYARDGAAAAKGDFALPENREALALLLSEPPPESDFEALDALYACWPRTTQNSPSRALLAVAHNVSRNFGLPGKLPMTTSKAWRMLSAEVFEPELAQRLADVGTFIADWQKTQRTFLILEFNEVELIEYLFEALHPGHHTDLLAGVMNFKVLSNRRMGLLRRIPSRIKKQVLPLIPERKQEAMVLLAHAKALLDKVADPSGFAPIVDTASKMAEEIEKAMRSVATSGAPPAPPPAGGGVSLGPMG